MKSQEVAADVAALLRARAPLIWIVTREEARVEGYLLNAAAAAGYRALMWDCAQGVTDVSGRPQPIGSPDIGQTLERISANARSSNADRVAWILRDLTPWVAPGPIGMQTCRQVRNLARLLPGTPTAQAQAVIVLSTSKEVPPELSNHAMVIDWPLPDRDEIGDTLDAAINVLPELDRAGNPVREAARPKNWDREAAIDAAVGLSVEEAQACFAKSLVQSRRIDPSAVAQEKKRVIAKEGVLEWLDPVAAGLDAVGGLENLKGWIRQRKLAYSPKAREYGLPAPKGILMVGVPGGGKTLTAKSLAAEWGVPLLKLDMGALKSKFVGDSEQNFRRALRVIEAIGRCIVLIDEIEKAMAGATQGAADGGVSADALGTLLSWMQDRKTEAFVMATANNVETLPPELLRKGRFDELFFVDLPNDTERASIAAAALRAHGRATIADDTGVPEEVAMLTDGFTGSEIAELVPAAMFSAFADGGREITFEDLKQEISTVVPLSKTAADKITKLREWAKNNARSASAAEEATAKDRNLDGARVLDF